MAISLTEDDLALYMGVQTIDSDRAEFLIAQAILLCESVVTPLPDAASVVVLSAAARAYSNPQGITQEALGPYSVNRPWAGIYLTKAERSALRRLGGSGGAFVIDPTPATAGVNNQWAQVALTPADVYGTPPYYGFDSPV